MVVLTHSLEMQISKTRFPSDLALTRYAPAETRIIPVIAALSWDRIGKIGAWIPETKAGILSFLSFWGLTGRSNSVARAETEKRQLGWIYETWKDKGGQSKLGWIEKRQEWGTDWDSQSSVVSLLAIELGPEHGLKVFINCLNLSTVFGMDLAHISSPGTFCLQFRSCPRPVGCFQ